jgi:hypothetical protein
MIGDSRLILARTFFKLKPWYARTGYGWCLMWLGLYVGYERPGQFEYWTPYGDGLPEGQLVTIKPDTTDNGCSTREPERG